MGSGGPATGVAVKDDLRTFHEIMAVQASREQIAAFALLVKSTAEAAAEIKEFQDTLGKDTLGKDSSAPTLATHDKTLQDSVESARQFNKNFLAGFSESQKAGLKEMLKRLGKADAEITPQAKALDRAVEANLTSPQIAGSAQNLDHVLTDFQRVQLAMGEEMSIPASTLETSTFNLTPIKSSFSVAGRPIVVTTARMVSRNGNSAAVDLHSGSGAARNAFSAELVSDLTDLQLSIADILRAQLDRESGCGERIAIQTAELTSRGSTAVADVQLHFERWACATVGRETMNEIVESDGSAQVILTPAVSDDGILRITGQIANVRAEGLMAESLRNGSLGETLRDKVAESITIVLRQCADFKAALPTSAGANATLKRAHFQGIGSGRLAVVFNGEIDVPDQQMQAMIVDLTKASAPEAVPGPLLPRPASPQETTSR